MSTVAKKKLESQEFYIGRQWGEDDGGHPSGVVTHASHRDPEAWAEQSDDWKRGYEVGWESVR